MEKLKSSLTNMLVVLTVISIIAAGVLASVNAVTEPQIEKIKAQKLEEDMKTVMQTEDLTVASADTIYQQGKEKKDANIQFIVYNIEKEGQSLGKAVSSVSNGFGGPLKVLVGFDAEGTILGYALSEHAETPGLGAKADTWFQQGQKGDIIGKNPGSCNFTVSKDGGDIDAITASTITSRAFLLAIQNAYNTVIAGTDAETGATTQTAKTAKHEGCKHECQGNGEGKHECENQCEGKSQCKGECDPSNCDLQKCTGTECGDAECGGNCENKHNCPKDKALCSHSHMKCSHACDMGTPEVIE